MYDRRQKKAVQKKWCDLVAHIAQDPLPANQMARKLTIFLSAPPGDGIRPSREFFKEYIKPILVAAAMDYDVIEGRKEGDVRYGTAEQIRRLRRKKGEKGTLKSEEEEPDTEQMIDMIRDKMQVRPEPGLRGDLVLGRHTWKEYIRGLHEGWLGPLDEPVQPEPVTISTSIEEAAPVSTEDSPTSTGDETDKQEAEKKDKKKQEETKKPFPPPAYISTNDYQSASLSPHIPSVLEPSQPIHQYHLLGFLKTPQRLYQFLNRRVLADQIGKETAAIVLAAHRPYQQDESFASSTSGDLDAPPVATNAPEGDAGTISTSQSWEQQAVLEFEERTWHKSVRKQRKDDDKSERLLMNEVVMDPRIAERMRKFELDPEEEQRATRIFNGEEKGRAIPLRDTSLDKPIVEKFD